MNCPWSDFEPAPFNNCEANVCGWIVAPADTWTNIVYFIVFVLILRSKNKSTEQRLFAISALIAGLGSMAFHGTKTSFGHLADIYSILAISMLLMTLAMSRYYRWKTKNEVSFYLVGLLISFCYPFFMRLGTRLFLLQILVAAVYEIRLLRAKRDGLNHKLFYWSLGLFVFGSVSFMLDSWKIICDPNNHILTLHGVWHFSAGIALYLLFLAQPKFKIRSPQP